MPARLRLVCGLAVILAVTRPTPSLAATACGALITNVATITMSSGFPDYIAYAMTYNITATGVVLCPPVVRCVKWVRPTIAGAGETLTFSLCVENQMSDTVWGITMTDALPGNMTFALVSPADYDTTLGGPFVLGAVVPSNGPTATCGVAGAPTVGQAPPWFLRWAVPGIGPAKSACVTYAARIL
jgi:uncharacterized repeat protein (TIGR01451 family)